MSQLPPEQRQRVKSALGKYARQRLTDTDLWPAIQAQAQNVHPISAEAAEYFTATPTPTPAARPPRLNLATMAISASVLLIIALLTYALLPAFTHPVARGNTAAMPAPSGSGDSTRNSAPLTGATPALFSTPVTVTEEASNDDQNLMTAAQSNAAQPLSLTETVNGYTVTLKKVYADTNIIVVSCSIDGPIAPQLRHDSVTLTAAGNAARVEGTMGTFQDKSTASKCAMQFDTPASTGQANQINLHLTASLLQRVNPNGDNTPPPATLAGPFNFDFTALVSDQVRVVNVGQTVVAGGIAFTLERLVITPGETNVIIRYTRPDPNPNLQWHPAIGIEGADWATFNSPNYGHNRSKVDSLGEGATSPLPDGSESYSFTANLYKYTGAWTLTVKDIYSVDVTNDAEQHYSGPWTFQFNVPGQ